MCLQYTVLMYYYKRAMYKETWNEVEEIYIILKLFMYILTVQVNNW